MKHVTIPEPVKAGAATIPLSQLLDEQVWGNPFWRAPGGGAARLKLLFEAHAKFEGAKTGDVVALTDAEHEAILPLVTMQGQQLPPHLSMPLARLMQAFHEATPEPPPGSTN